MKTLNTVLLVSLGVLVTACNAPTGPTTTAKTASTSSATACSSTCAWACLFTNGANFAASQRTEYLCHYTSNTHGWTENDYSFWADGSGAISGSVDNTLHFTTYTVDLVNCQVIVKVNGTKWYTLTSPVLDSNNYIISFSEMYQMDLSNGALNCSLTSSPGY